MNIEIPSAKPDFSITRFDLRLLAENDVAAYRALRSKIRNGDGARNFADSYTREDRLDEQSWHEWCTAKREHYIVGAFDKEKNNKLASIMMVTAQGPADSLIAEWEAKAEVKEAKAEVKEASASAAASTSEVKLANLISSSSTPANATELPKDTGIKPAPQKDASLQTPKNGGNAPTVSV